MWMGALTLVIGGRRLAKLVLPQGAHMGATKILGIVLLVAGLLGLFYGHFEYTKETHEGQFGPFRFSVAEKETAFIPNWASLAVIVAGVVLLVINRK
jgi:multidrug transporter EmrE-like cation transporter